MKKSIKIILLALLLVFPLSSFVFASELEMSPLDAGGELVATNGPMEIYALEGPARPATTLAAVTDPVLIYNSFLISGGYVTNGIKKGAKGDLHCWADTTKAGAAKATFTVQDLTAKTKKTKLISLTMATGKLYDIKWVGFVPTSGHLYYCSVTLLFTGITAKSVTNTNYHFFFGM